MSRSGHEGGSTRSTTATNETIAVDGDGGAGYVGNGSYSDSGSVTSISAALMAEVTCRVTMATRTNMCGGGGDVTAGDRFKADVRWPPTSKDLLCSEEEDTAPVPFTPPASAIATTHTARVTDASGDGTPATVLRFHAASTASGNCSCSANGGTLSKGGDDEGASSDAHLLRLQPLMPVAETLAEAARAAAAQEPGFDTLKMRFHLGKQMFRNLGARAGRTDLSALELQGAGAGRGCFQSVFSTWVPASAVPRVTSWLTSSLGFCLADTKTTATLHVINQELNIHKTTATLHVINQELNIHYSIALAMERGDDSTASLRKVKAGGSKTSSVTLMAAPQQLDLRLKLIPQFREHPALACDADAHSTARRVAAAVRMEGFDGFTRSKRGLPRNRHLEYARRKTKFVYEGYLPISGGGGQRLRVSVTQVQDDKGMHFEISGCLPEVDFTLRQLLTIHQQQQKQKQALQQRPLRRQLSEISRRSVNWAIPRWQLYSRSRSGGGADAGAGASVARGHCQLCEMAVTGSISSSPGPILNSSPPADAELNAARDSMWAEAALSTLSEFIVRMNRQMGQKGAMAVAAVPLGTS
ncbi:hypothetical protein Vafri_253 [Volvox africanus]|nr:hypothetical protein Vafri_253 [Volvox africanus]